MKSLLLLGTLGLFTLVGCTAQPADLDLSDDVSDDSAESAATALKTRITPGTFSLKDSLDEEVNEFCNVHTILELSNAPGAKAKLREVVGGFCELHVDPNTRTFNVRLESTSCGSKVYVGTRGRGSKKSAIRIVDHRERVCM
ncbi:MAG: hypothetical protein U0169_27930, partial [Polyangiaceae bacterium]